METLKQEIVLYEDGRKDLDLRRRFNGLLQGGVNLIKTLTHADIVRSASFSK